MPLNLLIKPCSSLCDMKCDYCFYDDECKNREVRCYGYMDDKTLEAVVSRAFEYARGHVSFSFQGGEPTLIGIGFYEKALELQKKYNAHKTTVFNSIQTNGRGINEEWADFLKSGGFSVGVSLDGAKEIHNKYRRGKNGEGTWDEAVAAADLLVSSGVDVNILCVVTEDAAKKPERVYGTLKKYKYLQFIPCLDNYAATKKPYSLTAESYKKFLNKISELYYNDYFSSDPVYIRFFDNCIGILLGRPPEMCGASGYCGCYGAVEADGSVYPCDFYMTDEYRLGNVRNNTFGEMLSSDTAKKFVSESHAKPDKCGSCRYFRLCGGGCRREYGKYCESLRGFFDKNYEKLAELALKTAFSSV